MRLRAMLPLLNALGFKGPLRRQPATQRILSGGGVQSPPLPPAIFSPELGGITLTPSADTLAVYVDHDKGDDSNDGLWPIQNGPTAGPKKTVPAGYAVLRDGKPDWLLLNQNQTFSLTNLYSGGADTWTKSGRSSDEPMVIASYGDGSARTLVVANGTDTPIIYNFSGSPTNIVTHGINAEFHGIAAVPQPSQPMWGTADAQTTGWTILTPSADTIFTYVSSSTGNDQWDGSQPAQVGTTNQGPKKTLKAAVNRMQGRNGKPDWLLLMEGDTFTLDGSVPNEFNGSINDPDHGYWTYGGRSNTERMVITSYTPGFQDSSAAHAGARPIIKTGGKNCAFNIIGDNPDPNGVFTSNLAFVGLYFWAFQFEAAQQGTADQGPIAIKYNNRGGNILIENCRVRSYWQGISCYSTLGLRDNILIRRNVIHDCFTWLLNGTGPDATANGIYMSHTSNSVVEENFLIHNGWTAAQDGLVNDFGTGQPVLRRNIYFDETGGPIRVSGNILTGCSGIQHRCGGINEDNFIVGAGVGILIGGGDGFAPRVGATVQGNVILDSNVHYSPSGVGIETNNTSSAVFKYNLVANNSVGTQPRPFKFGTADFSPNPGNDVPTLTGNVFYHWCNPDGTSGHCGYIEVVGDQTKQSNVTFQSNDIQESWTFSNQHLLIHQNFGSTTQWTASNNRYHSGRADNKWFNDNSGAGDLTLAQYKIDLNPDDTTSTSVTASYPTPAKTIVDFCTDHSISPATLAGFEDYLRALTRAGNWDPSVMARYANGDFHLADISPGGAGVGVQISGPIVYFQACFGGTIQSQGMVFTSISPSSGTHLGGTPVTIHGSGFLRSAAGSTFRNPIDVCVLGGGGLGPTIVDDNTITAITPAGSAGAADLYLDFGRGNLTVVGAFTYT